MAVSSAPIVSEDTPPIALNIARVAARLFAERGFDATSVREIAEAAGVTKPTLYYYFGSKQGLGEAILTRPMASMEQRLVALAATSPPPTDLLELLRAIFQIHIDFVVDDPDRARFVYAVCFGPSGSGFRDEVHRYGDAFDRSLLDATTRLVAARLIAPDRVEAFTQICRGMIMSATLDHIFQGQALEDGLAGRLISDLLDGFALAPELIERQENLQ